MNYIPYFYRLSSAPAKIKFRITSSCAFVAAKYIGVTPQWSAPNCKTLKQSVLHWQSRKFADLVFVQSVLKCTQWQVQVSHVEVC